MASLSVTCQKLMRPFSSRGACPITQNGDLAAIRQHVRLSKFGERLKPLHPDMGLNMLEKIVVYIYILDMSNYVLDGEVFTSLNGSSTAAAQTKHMSSSNIYP